MTPNEKFRFLFSSYSKLVGIYILTAIGIAIMSIWFPELSTEAYEQTEIKDMLTNNPFKLFVLACIFAPIVEEMMFRTLINPSHSDLILLLCAWQVFIGISFLPEDIHWGIRFGFAAVLLFCLFYILKQLLPASKTSGLQQWLHRFTIPILIISSVLFGLMHVSNYVDSFTFNAALFSLIIFRVWAGFMMGWVKIKIGNLRWAMGLHFINNFVVVLIGVMTQQL